MVHSYSQIWNRLSDALTTWRPDWELHLEQLSTHYRVKQREEGVAFTDNEVFEALLLAILSNNTDWSKVLRIQGELKERFANYDLAVYAGCSDSQLAELAEWFKARRAGSLTLRRDLARLRTAAGMLLDYSIRAGSADRFFTDALQQCGSECENLAVAIGGSTAWKLPGFGVALAAEALRNLGFNVSKPDRHLLRAIGSWGLVEFSRWEDRTRRNAPEATVNELRASMHAVRAMARAVGRGVTMTDTAIWLACAKSGLWLTNDELAAMRPAE